MKKYILTALLLLALLLPVSALCAGTVMKVEGCAEWVSLRKEPSAYATRMKRIPLGALVTECRYANSDYTYCVYENMAGYVMTKYLAQTAETPTPAPVTTPNPNTTALYGLTIDKLSTRSGPCTTYEDMGTYSVKGQWIRVYCRAWDKRNGIWWVKVGIPYRGETRILWTGYKRFDKNSLPLESIPIGK